MTSKIICYTSRTNVTTTTTTTIVTWKEEIQFKACCRESCLVITFTLLSLFAVLAIWFELDSYCAIVKESSRTSPRTCRFQREIGWPPSVYSYHILSDTIA